MTSDDLRFAQHHLRILSGLYGLLRPLDLILRSLSVGDGLSGFRCGAWGEEPLRLLGDTLNTAVAEALAANKGNVVVNLASSEYFKAVRAAKLKARVMTPVFKDKVNGNYKMLMVFAKHQRGGMSRWTIRNRVLDVERLKNYTEDGYRFAPDLEHH